jgi:hypothetical protein
VIPLVIHPAKLSNGTENLLHYYCRRHEIDQSEASNIIKDLQMMAGGLKFLQ